LPTVRHAHTRGGEEVRALHERGVGHISDANQDGQRGLRRDGAVPPQTSYPEFRN
jgi:hypothetical protein